MMIHAIILALAAATQPTTPPNPAPKPAPPVLATGKYTILKISGDLDSDHLVRAVSAELDRTKDVSLVILELDGNRARSDVVARIGGRIKGATPPVAVLLKDSADRKVGVGQALLGSFATGCFIDPDTRIVGQPNDDLHWLAPAEVKWDLAERDLTGPLWSRLTDLGGDQTLPQVLWAPSKDAWAVPVASGKPWVLSSAAPAGGMSGPQPRQVIWGDVPRIEIDADAAVGLRICAEKVLAPGPILASVGFSPRSTRSNRSVESGLTDAGAKLTHIVDDAKLAVRKVATTLTIKAADHPTAEDYRRAGKAAMEQVDRALRELERADTLLSEYPELGRRHELPTPRQQASPWRTAIDGLRKDLDKQRTTARDFSSR